MLTFDRLKKYRHFNFNCEHKVDNNDSRGMWCGLDNVKCCAQNCRMCVITPPFISSGKSKIIRSGYHNSTLNDFKILSANKLKAYDLRKKKLSFSSIAKKLGISKTRAFQYVNEVEGFINKDGLNDKGHPLTIHKGFKKGAERSCRLRIRLHNDVIRFRIEPVDFLFEKTVRLKFTEYLPLRFDDFYVQVFKNGTLVVRFKKDIVGSSVDDVVSLSNSRVVDFLKSFSYEGVVFVGDSFEQLSRDYALLGTDFARRVVREGRKFFVFDVDDGRCRLEVDVSGEAEFEAVHPVKACSDASRSEAFFRDLIDNDSYLPSVVKSRLDVLVDNVDKFAVNSVKYAENIELHLGVLKSMRDVLKRIENKLK